MKKDRIDILMEKAQSGDAVAMGKLANCFYYGHLVEKSMNNAMYWAYKASNLSNAMGTRIYIKLFEKEYGTKITSINEIRGNNAMDDFRDSVKTCLKKYVSFKGRAKRKEYWYFFLFVALIILFVVFCHITCNKLWSEAKLIGVTFPWIYKIIFWGLICPFLSVTVRRLHDTDRSGWWALLYVIPPFWGWIWLLDYLGKESDIYENEYGVYED